MIIQSFDLVPDAMILKNIADDEAYTEESQGL